MKSRFKPHPITVAVIVTLGAGAFVIAPTLARANKARGSYVAGDFHNHTTCSDGSISVQKQVQKATGSLAANEGWGLDWFVQAGHGGNGNRNCTLAEDASLATPAYPLVTNAAGVIQGPTTTWQNSTPPIAPKGSVSGTAPNQNMWRWQSIQEFQYPLMEYLSALKNVPLFMGVESVVAGHEHGSMSVITGQMPTSLDTVVLPTTPGYTALGNANALAHWEYCFDRGDTDTSQGNTLGSTLGNNWNCSVTGSANAADANWSAAGQKLVGNSGLNGHLKTLEGLKWMKENHPNGSYYVPAHLERAGPFNPAGSNGFNVEHLRDFNNTAPAVAFGFETQPGHGASANRGEYQIKRNNFGTVVGLVDSVGGTTYGGTGVYGAQVGGVWDALLGEGRNWWFFASSDWHNRGQFGPDDRRSTQDFQPGEYQRNYTFVSKQNAAARGERDEAEHALENRKIRPQEIVDGLRTGNNFAASGQLIDRLAFVVCATGQEDDLNAGEVERRAVEAAAHNTRVNTGKSCATMGEKLVVRPGADLIVSIVARDPAGPNHAPYTFANPSLAQVGITQPINEPVLDHIDVIRGLVSGYKAPGSADYAGEWPRNTAWLSTDGVTAGLAAVPAAAKNTSAAVIKTFNASADARGGWTTMVGGFVKMTFRIPAVKASQYVRLRGTNLPPAVPFETDASGNPLTDLFTNASDSTQLRIPCTVPATNEPAAGATLLAGQTINGCPSHLAKATSPPSGTANPIAGQKAVSFDIAAWSDLWFYSNPIYVEVRGATPVAGVTRVASAHEGKDSR